MNYNSIDEILSAGINNMEVIRNNVQQDYGPDVIDGVNWFTFDGTVVSSIYVCGDSWIGFGSEIEHLKVNRRDGAMYSLYREEGTLYNYYKFLKIRWVGYSYYYEPTADHAFTYDVILWETGDISLHMASAPIDRNDGTYSLTTNSTIYPYFVNNDNPNVVFIKTDSGFEISDTLSFEPIEQRYLIRSGSNYYTVTNNVVTKINETSLTSSMFLNHGIVDINTIINSAQNVSNAEIIYWHSKNLNLEQNIITMYGYPPLPQIINYQPQTLANNSGINRAEAVASDDTAFTITVDGGQTWQYYNDGAWVTASTEVEGMSAETIKNITPDEWARIITSTTFSFRCALPSIHSTTSGVYISYI